MGNPDTDTTTPSSTPAFGEISIALKRSIIQHYLARIEDLMRNPSKDGLAGQAQFLGSQIVTRTLGWLHYEKIDGNSLSVLGYISGILLRQMDYLNSQPQEVLVPVVAAPPADRSTILKNFLEEVNSCKGSVHLDTIVQSMRTKIGSVLTFPRILSSETFKERQTKVLQFLTEQLKLEDKTPVPAIATTTATPIQSSPISIAKQNVPEVLIKFFQDQIVKLGSFTEEIQATQLAIDLQKKLGPTFDVPQRNVGSKYIEFHVALNDYFNKSIMKLKVDNQIHPSTPEMHTILSTLMNQRPSFSADTFSLDLWIRDVKGQIGYWLPIPPPKMDEHTRNYYVRVIQVLKEKRESIGRESEPAKTPKTLSTEEQQTILRSIINTSPSMKSRPEDLIYWANGVKTQIGSWCVLPIAQSEEHAAGFCRRVLECLTKKLTSTQFPAAGQSSPDESRLDIVLEIYRSAPSALANPKDLAVWNQRVLEGNSLSVNIQKSDEPQKTFRTIMLAVSAEIAQLSAKVKEAKIKTLSGILANMPCVTMDESFLIESMNSVRQELSSWVLLPKYNPSQTGLQNYSNFCNAVTQTLINLKR